MKVVILCGGKGTRLREETEYRPKPMVPIGNRPILWHIMQRFARYGHKDFVLCLGYKGEQIKDYFRNYRWNAHDVSLDLDAPEAASFDPPNAGEDWRVALCDTGQEAMTGWRVRAIRERLGSESFFLTYGDGVGDIDLGELLAFHRRSGAVCTLTAVHPPGRFGEIRFGSDGRVESFNEKPQTESGYINGGFMVCEPALLDYLPDDPACMLEQEPLRRLTAEGKLAAFRHEGFWQPMDTFQEFTLLNHLWTSGRAPWTA
ncbi:MAG TPA: glucose-1-phosphate cytidylyltransferase [Opitutaceae bacterium]|nr:glucose-1-phosphate cytidylyltransferase [Opitutaceae bacterium]